VSTAAHPGYAVTNLHDSGPGDGNSPMKILLNLLHPGETERGSTALLI
jgi:hypothetical protein